MALEIMTIASSSKGNCIIIRNDSITLLVDAGVSLTYLKSSLKYYQLDMNDIDGIIITHEHIDHISGLKRICSNYDIPVFGNRSAINMISERLDIDMKSYDISESGFSVGNIDIQPFRTRHDSIYSLGYSFMDKSSKISVATDLGCMTKGVYNNLSGSDIVFLESNHDEDMLINGTYPAYLKKRILSSSGHLSNECCSKTVLELSGSGTSVFILGHLSENNNTRRLAYSATADRLTGNGLKMGSEIILDVAAPRYGYISYSTDNQIRQII